MAGLRYHSALETYSIKLGRRWTSVRLEPDLMAALREIAIEMGCRPDELVSEIALSRSVGSLTSALRAFIVNHYRRRARGLALAGLGAPMRATLDTIDLNQSDARADDKLIELLKAWQAEPTNVLDPDVVKRCGLVGFIHVLDAFEADPMNYRFRVWGGKVRLDPSRDLGGSRLGDFPAPAYRAAVARDYFTTVTTGCARLQIVRASVFDMQRAYQRLLLPVSGHRGKPDRLAVAVVYQAAR